ncbi:MAG: carbamoyltransferase HypF [Synergistetes bacterium]|nr:carbamoyltransferase HypF [Synergistota bacterium]MCX8127843.1 carbamoyltransferase HypF [Synergistota bacterium]MDW8192105.1 carbamoyltransferase HypF [Synergistota bacterium]
MKRIEFKIYGVVQGVGFRPFVSKLANSLSLGGWVKNTSECVEIEIIGEEEVLNTFLSELINSSPPLSKIVKIEKIKEEDFKDAKPPFKILKSEKRESINKNNLWIPPDVGTCDDCLRELFNPADRRYKYPFINCTNCGPRFTIIMDIPYDREKTTMRTFKMCKDCEREYYNIEDRRFHAQPNACPICGPSLSLLDKNGKVVYGDPIENTIKLLKDGKIVAIKGLGGFHLAVDALNKKAIIELRKRKKRPHKPFALMAFDMDRILKFALATEEEKKILLSPSKPIVLLRKRSLSSLPEEIAPNNKYLGFMLPYTPIHYLITKEFQALIMTSGNLSDEPIIHENDEALTKLNQIADFFLVHNRDIFTPCDDSIVINSSIIRRARGYTPLPLVGDEELPPILACGGEEKSSFALSRDNTIILSQYIGDLKDLETLERYELLIERFKNLFNVSPKYVVCDLHPLYLSTKYAEKTGLPILKVQHHHAHLASCMWENGLKNKVIGIILDGTGYGEDETIWGGEILVGDLLNFERIAHFKPIPLPGGDKAIKEPWRVALSYLKTIGRENLIKEEKAQSIIKMLSLGINSPLSSGCGRLFDAVSAFLGIRREITYEAQAAIELEGVADENEKSSYSTEILMSNKKILLNWGKMWNELTHDMMKGVPLEICAMKFHNYIVNSLSEATELVKNITGINDVVLSGGVFQNQIIFRKTIENLTKMGFKVYHHKEVPTNDQGIAVGQLAICAAKIKKGEI